MPDSDNDIVDVAGRTLIDRIALSGFGTTPAFWAPSADPSHPVDPALAKIQKFVELDMQLAEQFGGAPNKQLLQLLDKVSRHRTATPAEDVERAGELLVKDVKHKTPSSTDAFAFLTFAEMSIKQAISEHDPAHAGAAASKFARGQDDGRSAAKKTVAETKYILGGISGFLEEMIHEAVDEIKHFPPPPSLFKPAAPTAGGLFDDRDSSLGGLGAAATVAPATVPAAPKARAQRPAGH